MPRRAKNRAVAPHDTLLAPLEAARGVIEARFSDAGDVLAQAVDGIAALVSALDELTAALSPEVIAATTQQLALAADTLIALPGKQRRRQAGISRLVDMREILSAHIGEMRQNLAYMRAFTVSIKITVGGIACADAEFAVFAQEISLRVAAGRAEVDALEGSLFHLRRELQTARGRAEACRQRCADMLPAVPDQLLASAAVMAGHHGRIAAAAADVAELARGVRKKVARMLGALQIGDITRQRVEHIQSGMAMLETIDPTTPPALQTRLRSLMLALLAAQLDSTLLDFNHEVAEIDTGLAGLAQDAAALLSLRDLAYGEAGSTPGGFLRALEQRVGAAVGLVAEIEAADALVRETGRNAAAAARSLSDRLQSVQTIKSDVLYMALNTTLKSARLGDAGRPLSPIATELRTHAGYLEVTANQCAAALQTLTCAAAGLAAEDVAEDDAPDAGAALGRAIARINAAGNTTERDIATCAAQGEAVLELLTRSAGQMAMHSEIGEALARVATDLGARAAGASICGADLQAPAAALFARLGAIYTMAQERQVQAEVAAQWGIAAPAGAAPASAASDDELESALF